MDPSFAVIFLLSFYCIRKTAPILTIPFTFLDIFTAFMANEQRFGNDRRSMTISVILLGITLCVVFLAYFAFSEINNNSDATTVQFATIVSALLYELAFIWARF